MKLYEDLGVEPGASDEEIKKAFWEKSKKLHPDVGGDAEAMRKLTYAYSILKDKDRRNRYNSTGDERVGDSQDIIRHIAIERLTNLFNEILRDPQILTLDIKNIVMTKLRAEKINVRQKEKDCRRTRKILEQVLEKMDCGKEAEFFRAVIKQNLEGIRMSLEMFRRDRDIFSCIENIMRDFEYNFDQPNYSDTTTGTGNIRIQFGSGAWRGGNCD